MTSPNARVLIVAGSDSGGGAGIQADIKTVTMLGGYAATAVTAITVQNTLGVESVHAIPVETIVAQMRVVLEDIGADAIKTGMLATAEVVSAVAAAIDAHGGGAPAVVDPVMVAKGGHRLLAEDAIAAVRAELIARAAIVTPNLPEAEALVGFELATMDDRRRAGEALLAMGAGAALIKGGHGADATIVDLLVTPEGAWGFEGPRIATRNVHGTGCTLASAIAVKLAQGRGLREAVGEARAYLLEAIARAPGLGKGHGPVDHGWPLREGS